MDVITQQCAVCGLLKTDANNPPGRPWVRVGGVSTGSSPQPINVVQPQRAGAFAGQRGLGLNWQAIDLCPDCAVKTTADKLPGLYAAKLKPSK